MAAAVLAAAVRAAAVRAVLFAAADFAAALRSVAAFAAAVFAAVVFFAAVLFAAALLAAALFGAVLFAAVVLAAVVLAAVVLAAVAFAAVVLAAVVEGVVSGSAAAAAPVAPPASEDSPAVRVDAARAAADVVRLARALAVRAVLFFAADAPLTAAVFLAAAVRAAEPVDFVPDADPAGLVMGSMTTSPVAAALSSADRDGVRSLAAFFAGAFRAVVFLVGFDTGSATSSGRSSGEAVTFLRYQRGPSFFGSPKQLAVRRVAFRHFVYRPLDESGRWVCTGSRNGNGASCSRMFPGSVASMTLGTTKCLIGEPIVNTTSLGALVTLQTVILAAGMGSRLGRALPKPLTELSDGRTIMRQQHDNIRAAFGSDARITAVVGYRAETIIEAFPSVNYVHNERYDETNTSKSLLRALAATGKGGVLWMNGDVVFDPMILGRAAAYIERDQSFVTVNTSKVSDEEVKYTVTAEGFIKELSKTVKGGLGEAVGINYISSASKKSFMRQLQRVEDQDYFERGLELAIAEDGLLLEPMDVSDLYAVEVDFAEDLERANLFV